MAVYSGNSKIILQNSILFQIATVLVPAAPSVPPAASTAQERIANNLNRLDTEVE